MEEGGVGWVEVEGAEPGVAQGEGYEGEVGLGAGREVWVEVRGVASLFVGIGEEVGGRDRERGCGG